jgi:hypothetical protein
MKAIKSLFSRMDSPWLVGFLNLAAFLVYLIQAVHYAHSMDVTMDEGTYLMKGLLFVRGIYQPFQDYGPITNKMPLSFLIPGAAQAVFGPGLRTGRYFSIFLGLLMLLAVWLAGKRLGGRWGSVAAVWAVAANPTNIMYYTVAISQVLTICLLAWAFALTLGRRRPTWQLVIGAVFSSLTVMVRQNMAPVVPLLVLYVFWDHGWRKGLWTALTAFLTLVIFHALYWPNIMTLWQPYLPELMENLLNLRPVTTGGGVSISQQSYDMLTRLYVFWDGMRSNFLALMGAVIAWILWPARKDWKSPSQFRISVILSLILVILTGLHIWASIGQTYCLFCYSGYLAFFNVTGILLVIVSFTGWVKRPGAIRSVLGILVLLVSMTGLGYAAYNQLDDSLLRVRVPRISGMQFKGGTTELWRLLTNKFGWSYEALQKLIPTAAGAAAGLLLVAAVLVVYLVVRRRQPGQVSYAHLAVLVFFVLGVLLTPTVWMAGWRTLDMCGGDVIASHEAVGAHLAAIIPPGSLVYWENDISPLPLLYIPGVRIFPPQLNHWYTYLQGGDPNELERLGYWNAALAERWKTQADYLLVAERYVAGWASGTTDGEIQFDELSPAPATVPCRDRSIIHIFRRVK